LARPVPHVIARREAPKESRMTPRSTGMTLLATTLLAGCHCANADIVELGSEGSTSTSGEALTGSSASNDSSTGEPFDGSRWIGRYHFENFFLPFGERGDPHGDYALVNFEVLPDGWATIFYDSCSFDEPVTRTYEWTPDEEGWLDLQAGPGEPWLRFLGPDRVDTLRVQLVEPCRELWFEIDGRVSGWMPFFPGESCWVDRCTTPGIMQVDYCEGEEPPSCP
jgi:hypothetical protein